MAPMSVPGSLHATNPPTSRGTRDLRWESRCEVTEANRGREFAYVVAGTWIRLSFTFADAAGDTRVTEIGRFLPQGLASFHGRFGDDAEAEINKRVETARQGMREALAAIKRVAESE